MKTYRNALNTVHVVKQTKFLLTKLTAVQVQRNFYPTKITRYTVVPKGGCVLGGEGGSSGLNSRVTAGCLVAVA